MSGIYIPGLEMPTSCWLCHFQDCGNCVLNNYKVVDNCIVEDRRDEDCPLVPVPDHGRTIDADALPTYDKPIGKLMMFGGEYVYTQTAIDNAPTIIPADPAKEGEG